MLITPKRRVFYIDTQLPGLKRTVKVSGQQRIYRFFAEQVPPIKAEPRMPPWPEVAGLIHVSTYRSLQELGRWYWGLVKDQLDLDDETRRLARKVAQGATTDLEKVKAVFGWVVKNTRYVALEFGIYGYKPRRCVQTVARGWGDCKDKATVIVSMLKELGVPATLVIVRSQNRGGFRSKVASLAPYDHMIAYVPSLDLYLDGTAEFAGATELPQADMGALAIQVNQGDAKPVRLPEGNPNQNVIERTVVATLAPDGTAKLQLSYQTSGVRAPEWRSRYHAKATLRERVNADLGREFPGFVIEPGPLGVTTSDLENLERPVRVKVRGSADSFARREGSELSMAVTTALRLTPTFASLPRRTQDVRVLGFSTIRDTFVVKLPRGATVTSMPRAASADTKFGSYSVRVNLKPGQVVVTSHVSVKVSRVTPGQYAAWRRFCADADQALSPRLVVTP